MASEDQEPRRWHKFRGLRRGGGTGSLYGIGILGALVYFIQHATTFPEGLVGIVKAIFWPALLVYKALEQLKF